MSIRTGDKVVVISGSSKGKAGVVSSVKLRDGLVFVDGLNVKKRAKKAGSGSGNFVDLVAGIHVSNVKLVERGSVKSNKK